LFSNLFELKIWNILNGKIISGEIAHKNSLKLEYRKLFAPSPKNNIDINGYE
jgi:hypothetical protein